MGVDGQALPAGEKEALRFLKESGGLLGLPVSKADSAFFFQQFHRSEQARWFEWRILGQLPVSCANSAAWPPAKTPGVVRARIIRIFMISGNSL